MREYSVGIIGFGFIGKVHAYGYVNLPLFYDPLPLNARITHVCTSRPETALAAARMVGAEHAVTDYRQVTENPAVDIVHICSPNRQHKEELLSAIAHGKHIYCDKPLVSDWAGAQDVAAALERYRGTSQMTLQNRFYPAIMRAKQMIQEGFLGQVLGFRAAYLHAGSADPKAPLKWKLSGSEGGGVIADLATHVMDLVEHLLGPYDRLLAQTRIAYPQRPSAEDPKRMVTVDAEDLLMVLAKLQSGAMGTIEATKLATGAEDEMRLEIHGSQGALRFNGMDPHHLEAYDVRTPQSPIGGTRGWVKIDTGQRFPAPAAAFPGPKFAMGWIRTHMACLANFLGAVARGEKGDPNLSHGVHLQRLVECTRQSARQEAWVSVGAD